MLTKTEKFALDHFLSDYPMHSYGYEVEPIKFQTVLDLIQDEDEDSIDIWAPFSEYPRDWVINEIIKMEKDLKELLK